MPRNKPLCSFCRFVSTCYTGNGNFIVGGPIAKVDDYEYECCCAAIPEEDRLIGITQPCDYFESASPLATLALRFKNEENSG